MPKTIVAKKLPFRCMCTSYEDPETGRAWLLKDFSISQETFEEAIKVLFNVKIKHTSGKLDVRR